ncbi:MAG: bifunctional serine/threonine-protein kinase/ABC transporter substrate-binding protein [Chloroflexota bacterium]
MANLIGQTLGQYRIMEQIGQGGMATVYKAYQPSLDRYVAVKVLPPYFAHEPGFAMRFTREAKAIARLNHPNILPIYDFGQEGDLSYIVMKYVEAGTLKDLVGAPMPLDVTADIVRQIAAALDHAHQRGILHRDVKPSNVLLDEGRWVLLTDFGLAKMVEGSAVLTASGVGVGTPAYMAPEQGRGEAVDARADIYALGVVLYEMLTGRVPFEAETPMAVVIKHITEPLPLPRTISPEMPEAVERVILKTLAKNPADRFATPLALIDALTAAVAGVAPAAADTIELAVEPPLPEPPAVPPTVTPEPEPAPPPETPMPVPTPTPPAAGAPPKRKTFPWRGAGCLVGIVGLVLATLCGLGNLRQRQQQRTPTVETAAATATPRSQPTATLRPGVTPEPTAKPTQPPIELPDVLFEQVYFKTDFESGAVFKSLPDGWAIEDDGSGNHVLRGKPPEPVWLPDSEAWSMYVLEADIRLVEGDEAYVLARYDIAAERGIALVCAQDRWEAATLPGMATQAVSRGIDNMTAPQHLRLVVLEERLIAFLNDTFLFEVQTEPLEGGVGLSVHDGSKLYLDNVRITGPAQSPAVTDWELYDDFNAGFLDEERWEWQPAVENNTAKIDPEGRLVIEARNPEAEERYGRLAARTDWPILEVQADLIVKELKGELTDFFVFLSAEGGRMAGIIGESGNVAAFEGQGGLRILRENQGIPAEFHLHLILTPEGQMEVIVDNQPVGKIPAAPLADGFAITYRIDPGGTLVGVVDNVQVRYQEGAAVSEKPADQNSYACDDPLGCVEIPPDKPIHLAYLLDLSGVTASLSQDILYGIELAIEDRLDILGHAIELTGEDSGCTLLGGRQAATLVAKDPSVVAVIGTTCSRSAGVAAPILTNAGLVMVSPANTNPLLTKVGQHQAGYLRVSPNDEMQGVIAAEFARSDTLGAQTAAILLEENDYSDILAGLFAQSFKEMGGTIVAQEWLESGNEDSVRRALEVVAQAKPDLVYYPLFVDGGALVTRLARETPGLEEAVLMGADGMFSAEFLAAAGAAAEGVYLTSPDVLDVSDRYRALLERFQARYGAAPTSLFHAYGYDATALVLSAIKTAAVEMPDGTLYIPRLALREALFATRNYEGLTGSLSCTSTGDCAAARLSVYQVVTADPVSWKPPDVNPRRVWP